MHVDIKKLGNIPDGGGHKVLGRQAGRKTRRNAGYSYLHTAVDDHSRLAYSEIHADEKKETATAFWQRAHAFFTGAGITVERVLTDNGSCYRSRDWRDSLAAAGITHKRTRPYRPQTNGKVERFNRTLLDEWAYARPYRSDIERREAFPGWLHSYNHHRGHTALAGKPPASRVPNLTRQSPVPWTAGPGPFARADRVLPTEAGDEVAARTADRGAAELPDEFHDVRAEPVLVRARVLRLVEPGQVPGRQHPSCMDGSGGRRKDIRTRERYPGGWFRLRRADGRPAGPGSSPPPRRP